MRPTTAAGMASAEARHKVVSEGHEPGPSTEAQR